MGKSSVVTQTVTSPADLRVQLESLGSGAQFISPEATYAAPGAVAGSVGSYSQLTQSFNQPITTTGLTGKEVRDMLVDQQAGAAESVKQLTQLSTEGLRASQAALGTLASSSQEGLKASQAALGTLASSSQAALGTIAATKTGGEPVDWTKYIPYAIVAVIVIAMARSRRKAG